MYASLTCAWNDPQLIISCARGCSRFRHASGLVDVPTVLEYLSALPGGPFRLTLSRHALETSRTGVTRGKELVQLIPFGESSFLPCFCPDAV